MNSRSLPHRGRPGSRAGFTLVEMMISAALMAVLLGAAYACLKAGLDSRKIIEPRGDVLQIGRVALDLLSADLRGACALHKGPEFLGMKRSLGTLQADNLDFATHHYTPQHPGEGDYCSVSWYVERDPVSGETRLWRRKNPTMAFDPLSGGAREEIAVGVRGFQLEYYDGFEWYETWGDPQGQVKQQNSNRDRFNLTGLPEAVRITLQLSGDPNARKTPSAAVETDGSSASDSDPASNEPPPFTFQSVVRLNLAAVSTGSAASTSTSGTGGSAPGNPQGGGRPSP